MGKTASVGTPDSTTGAPPASVVGATCPEGAPPPAERVSPTGTASVGTPPLGIVVSVVVAVGPVVGTEPGPDGIVLLQLETY